MWTLVTGGAKGLGAEICRTLASRGHNVIVHYRQSYLEALNVVESCRSFGVHSDCLEGDLSDIKKTEDFLERLSKKFDPICHLINNVGSYLIKPAMETSLEEWEGLYRTNFYAPLQLIMALSDTIRFTKGSIINLGVAGLQTVRADCYSTAYTAAKLSLWMVTKSLAKELAPDGVRVNMVSPGYLENSIDLPKNLSTLPMKRSIAFDEVARVIAFLLEKENIGLTGQNIEVAGGVRL